MEKKSLMNNKAVYMLIIIILIAGALFGLVKVKNYIGYSMINASAGTITGFLLDQRECTSVWGAYYGMAVMVYNYNATISGQPDPCLAEQKHLLFGCMSKTENEVYASLARQEEIDWGSVNAASPEDIDDYLGYIGSERDSANETFRYNLSITLGSRTISAPATYTKQYGNSDDETPYNLLILKDSNGTLIYATIVADTNTQGFKPETINYQLMLPIPNQTNPRYYFYADPYEECPAGEFGEVGSGYVYGYVTDNITGNPLESVEVHVSGSMNSTDANGFYNFSTYIGESYVIGIKEGYQTYVGLINVSTNGTRYNFSMNPIGQEYGNGTIHGYVVDNTTKLPLVNATVSVWGVNVLTNNTGEYTLSVIEGTHNIIGTKEGYDNYVGEVDVIANIITEHNISLTETVPLENLSVVTNGTIKGIVVDNNTLEILPNVTISVAGVYAYSNSSGEYEINVKEGIHNLVAFETGYYNYIEELTVIAQNTTYHNITMEPAEEPGEGEGQGPGAGAGQGAGLGAGLGAGKGPGTGIIAQVEQPVVIKEFDVSVRKILKKLRVGSYINVPVTISNYMKVAANIRFSVEGDVKDMVRLDKEVMTVDSGAQNDIILTILANVEPGIYEGNLVISGDMEYRLPIYVLVLEKERLDVEALVVKIMPEKRKVTAGSLFKYRVDLQNLLTDEKYKVDLKYSIKGINNNVSLFIEEEDIAILTSFSLLKRHRLSKELKKGDYQLIVTTDYLDLTTEHATIFTIKEAFYMYKLFGVIPVWAILIFAGVTGTGVFLFLWYKKKQEEKKRYLIEVDYSELPKPGPRSAYVGLIAESKRKTYFDLEAMTTHTIVAGSTGGGKTVSAQGIVEEALMKGVSVLIFDPTAQWTGFLRKCQNKKMFDLYPKFSLKKSDARAFNGNIHQVVNARELIEFKKFVKPGEINVFVANKLEVRDYEIFVSNIIREIFKQNLPEARQLKTLLLFDEFHRLLPKYGGTGEVLIQVERAAREFRKWGIGLVLISQVIGDFQAEVLANINTQIQMRTKEENDLNRIKEEYGENLLKSLVKASIGSGMVENSNYNKGKPYFVSFRPLLHSTVRLSDEELENYNKYNAIIDDLEYQLDQLEKLEVDVFDLRLELKLAQDKVKSGSFNMVNIYLEGLKPRIKSQWDKLGKKPKKKEIKLVSEEQLKKELDKAKKAKQKEEEKEGKKPQEEKKEEEKPEPEEKKEEPKKDEEKPEQKEGQEEKKEGKEENNEKEDEDKKEEDKPEEIDEVEAVKKELKTLLEEENKDKILKSMKDLDFKIRKVYKEASKEEKVLILGDFNKIRKKVNAK